MARDVEYLDVALQEAEAAAGWYAERSASAAEGFAIELESAASWIGRMPEAWPPFDHGTRRFLLRRYPFSVIYRVEAKRILILAVAHAHRKPGYWAQRV